MSLKEAQELFTKEFEETTMGLSKFCSLVKAFSGYNFWANST